MSNFSIKSIKDALCDAFNALPDWANLKSMDKGTIIDKTFKSIFKDLMNQFGMKPGVDYVDSLRDNEPCTDFVTLSPRADDLLTGLLTGKIVAIKEHSRVSQKGNTFKVSAHYRDLRKKSA